MFAHGRAPDMTDLHSPEIQLIRFRRRVLFAGALVLLAFGLLLARFVWLQVVMHDYYQTRDGVISSV